MTSTNVQERVNTEAPEAPETPKVEVAEAPKATATKPRPPAYAGENEANALAKALANLKEEGWTRPLIREATGLTDSQVYRAQNGMVHFVELPTWVKFSAQVEAGELTVPEKASKKVDPAALLERLQKAANVLATAADAKGIKQLREIVEAAQEFLPEPTAPEAPEVPAENKESVDA